MHARDSFPTLSARPVALMRAVERDADRGASRWLVVLRILVAVGALALAIALVLFVPTAVQAQAGAAQADPPQASAEGVTGEGDAADARAPRALSVLLLSGLNNHDWRATTPALREALEETGRFRVTVLERTETLSAELLAPFDVVVSNFNTFVSRAAPERDPGWSARGRKALLDFVASGKGHVTVHAGSSSFYDWPEYRSMTLGRFLVGQTSHGKQHEFRVELSKTEHPVTRGIAPFSIVDELWHGADLREDAVVLATAYSSIDSGGSGHVEPVLAAGDYGRGRSVFLVLGHDVRAISAPGFRALLAHAAEWAATGQVALPPAATAIEDPSEMPGHLSWQRDPASLALLRDGQIVWRLVHGGGASKAHFDVLGPVGGPSLAWERPPDHPWHHGLWFSWKLINGLNYWEEDKTTGRAQGLTTVLKVQEAPELDGAARIDLELAYHPAERQPEEATLTESRRVDVGAPREDGSYTIDWRSRFTAGAEPVVLERTPPPGEEGGVSYGGYAGLSLRFRDLADRELVSSEGPLPLNTVDRFRGRARAFELSGAIDGVAVGVAMLDDPRNGPQPTPWYAIRSPEMTYLNAAVICFQNLRLEAHQALELRYRLIVHRGRWDAARLAQALRTYEEDAGLGRDAPGKGADHAQAGAQ